MQTIVERGRIDTVEALFQDSRQVLLSYISSFFIVGKFYLLLIL